jgi:hypothetical protein
LSAVGGLNRSVLIHSPLRTTTPDNNSLAHVYVSQVFSSTGTRPQTSFIKNGTRGEE